MGDKYNRYSLFPPIAISSPKYAPCRNTSGRITVRSLLSQGRGRGVRETGNWGALIKRLKPLKIGRCGGNVAPANFRGLPPDSESVRIIPCVRYRYFRGDGVLGSGNSEELQARKTSDTTARMAGIRPPTEPLDMWALLGNIMYKQ